MSRCETHCPQPSGFPWLVLLLVAAAALALWAIGQLVQAVAVPVRVLVALVGVVGVGGMVALFIADAIAATPRREKRARYSELPAPMDETTEAVAEPEPAYPPLRAVPDLDATKEAA